MESDQRLLRMIDADLAMLPAGPIAIAFSGGLDSSALLHLLASSPEVRERGLRAIHVDHGLNLRSGAWAMHCAQITQQLDVPLQIMRTAVETARGLGPEAAARSARYSAFERALGENEILALAHHRDDQTETVMLKLLRGSGPQGLAAMRRLRRLGKAWAWRPLLDVPRDDLRQYAQRHQLEWIDDPSNEDIRIERNFLRQDVLPGLRGRWPTADASICQSANWIRAAVDFIDTESSRALASLQGLDPATLHYQGWLDLPDALRDPVLRLWLRNLDLAQPNQHQVGELERQLKTAREDKLPCVRFPGTELHRYRELLYAMPPLEMPKPGWEIIWDGQPLALPASLGTLLLENPTGLARPLAKADHLLVRFRQGGERLRLVAGNHHRELRDLFQEAGIPPWQRGRIPMILNHQGDLLSVGDLWQSALGRAEFTRLDRRLQWNHALTVQ
ncbi:MAG: tRNA lysidine(34) synthetase TilS [Dokdonella sp.]